MKSISKKVLGLLAALVVLVNSIGMLALTASASEYTNLTDKLYVTANLDKTTVAKGEKFIVTYKMENYAAYAAAHATTVQGDGNVGLLAWASVGFSYDKLAFAPTAKGAITKSLVGTTGVTFSLLTTQSPAKITFGWDKTGDIYYEGITEEELIPLTIPTTATNLFQVEFTALAAANLTSYTFPIITSATKFNSWKEFYGDANQVYPSQVSPFTVTVGTADVGYTVEYYYGGVKDDAATVTGTGAVGTAIPNSPKDKVGYTFANKTNDGGLITAIAANNVITYNYSTDKTDLITAISDAHLVFDPAVPGIAVGEYPPDAYAAFNTAIQTAEAENLSSTSTPTTVSDAVTALLAAQAIFEGTIITVPKDSNSAIKQLSLVNGTISPAFSPSELTYTVTVAKATDWINIFPFVSSSKATFKYLDGSDAVINAGTATNYLHVALTGSARTFKIEVTAEDQTKTVYTFNVVKPIAIKNLSVTFGTCTNVNDAAGTISVVANPSASYINIAPYMAPGLSYSINGTDVTFANAAYASINVKGLTSTTATLTITDGTTPKEYIITITRELSTDTSIKGVALTNATISDTTILAATNASLVYMVPVLVSTSATYELFVNNVPTVTYTGGAYIAAVIPAVKNTEVKVIVTSESGAKNTVIYTIAKADATNTALTGISLTYATKDATTITVQPGKTIFYMLPYVINWATAVVYDYSGDVDHGVLAVNYKTAIAISKTSGVSKIKIVVTAQDGSHQDYFYNVAFN